MSFTVRNFPFEILYKKSEHNELTILTDFSVCLLNPYRFLQNASKISGVLRFLRSTSGGQDILELVLMVSKTRLRINSAVLTIIPSFVSSKYCGKDDVSVDALLTNISGSR